MNIFELFGTIAVENKDANEAIDETSQKANSFTQNLRKGIATAAKWGTGIAAAAVTAATMVAKKMNDIAQNAASYADEIDKTSQKMGLSAEAFQEWRYAFERSGIEFSEMEGGVASMLDKMKSVNEGNEDAIKLFDALGMSCFDAKGNMKDAETIMREVIFSLSRMSNETERTQLAMEIFGGAGEKLGPLLNSGEEGIKNLMKHAHELGLIMSDEDVKAGAKFTDTMTDVNGALQSITNEIGFKVMPPLENFYNFIIAKTPEIKEKVGQWAEPLAGIMDEFTKELQWLFDDTEGNRFSKGMERIDKQLGDDITSIEDKFSTVESLVSIIDELAKKTNLTEEETYAWEAATKQLCGMIPEFNGIFDSETHSINGGTEALQERIKELKNLAIEEAKAKALQGKRDALAQAYANIANMQFEAQVQKPIYDKRYQEWQEAKTAYEDAFKKWGRYEISNEEYFAIADKYDTAEERYFEARDKYQETTEALESLVPAVEAAEENLRVAEEVIAKGIEENGYTKPEWLDNVKSSDVAGLESKLAQIITLLAQAVTNMGRDTALYLNGAVIAGAISKNINGLWSKETIRSERGN